MAVEFPKNTKTVSAKLPEGILKVIDQMAVSRGVTRSGLIRELAEAAADGRVIFKPPRALVATGSTALAPLGASDVGRAVRRRAQADAVAALSAGPAAQDVDLSALDLDAVVLRATRLLAEGR